MKPNSLTKGFRPKAESISIDLRNRLNLEATDACPARRVARLLQIQVVSIQMLRKLAKQHLTMEFPDPAQLDESLNILENRETGFSAMATIIGEHKIIIFNELNSIARQESDIMHELAHVLCKHPGNCLSEKLRKYDNQHENEAIWLGATIQIPEIGLLQLAKQGKTNQQIAENYGASLQMTTYRRNILGIDKRISRSKTSTPSTISDKV